ncbi:hypothetical protein ACIBKY_52980, partial [Nonomuraea sp. NPDC050394]
LVDCCLTGSLLFSQPTLAHPLWPARSGWKSLPDIGRDDLIRHFTLTRADIASSIPAVAAGLLIALGLPFSSRRCLGLGLYLTR